MLLHWAPYMRVSSIGVNAIGDAGNTSPGNIGQPGICICISSEMFVMFLLSHAWRYEHGAVF